MFGSVQVGLWDIDHPPSSGDGDSSSSSYDGVLMFEPHRDYVSSLRWANLHTLISGSYDGTVRTLDVNTGGLRAWLLA
jgi:WD40 repeat protein